MRFEFIPTDEFARELKRLAKKYKSLKVEFEELQNQLEKINHLEQVLEIILRR